MSRELTATAQAINEAHERAKALADTAIGWAVKCGELLAAKKSALPHGEFGPWVAKNCNFSDRQARRYMEVATKTDTRVRFDSMRQAIGYDKPAPKPAAKREPEALQKAVESGEVPLKKAASVTSLPKAEQIKAATAKPEPAKPVEVEPEPEFDLDGYEPDDDEDYKANIANVLMADDKLAALTGELRKIRGELAAMTASRNHFQRQATEAIKTVKARDREIAALKRQIQKAAA